MPSYATVAEAREHPAIASLTADLTDSQIAGVLDAVEARIEEATELAWTPREATERHVGDGTASLTLDRLRCRTVTTVEIDGDTVDVSHVTLTPHGRLTRTDGVWPAGATVEVAYQHGDDEPPADLVDAALRAAGTILAHSSNPRVGERTDSIVGEGMTINFAAIADVRRGRPFGMPDVDYVVMSRAARRVWVG